MLNYFRQMRAKELMLFLARITLVIPCLVLLMWIGGSDALHKKASFIFVMSPLTAVLMIGLCVSLMLWVHEKKMASKCISCFILITATFKLVSFSVGPSLFINRDIFTLIWHSNLFAPNTALNFILLSLSLLIADSQKRTLVLLFQGMCTLAFAIALLAVLGHLYTSSSLYDLSPSYSPMSAQTALAFLIISYGILLLKRKRGFMAELISRHNGGALARKLMPLCIILPGLLGWLRIRGQNLGYYSSDFGIALLVVSHTFRPDSHPVPGLPA